MKLTLQRLPSLLPCTFGELLAQDGQHIAVTLEEPWRDNQRSVSCIPAGEYPWFKRVSPKRGYEVIELRDVPDRSNVQLHIGNTLDHTEGCVLVGTARGEGVSITGSRNAFKKLMAEVAAHDSGTLVVVNPE